MEKQRESLDRQLKQKEDFIREKEIERNMKIMKKRDDKMHGIYRTLEKN